MNYLRCSGFLSDGPLVDWESNGKSFPLEPWLASSLKCVWRFSPWSEGVPLMGRFGGRLKVWLPQWTCLPVGITFHFHREPCRPCSKYMTPCSNSAERGCFSNFCRKINWGSQRLKNLPDDTELSDESVLQRQTDLISKSGTDPRSCWFS